MSDPWYLLYFDVSPDGRGPSRYVGRTTDIRVAQEHLNRIRRSPYNVGYVLVVTDTKTEHLQ
jgi:hypothetical protein